MKVLIFVIATIIIGLTGCSKENPSELNSQNYSCISFNKEELKKSIIDNQYGANKIGDHIEFGEYRGKPLEWIVLAFEDGKLLIIIKNPIGTRPYNDVNESVTWEKCTLRKWLNSEFYDDAFSDSEKAVIAQSIVERDTNPWNGLTSGRQTKDYVYILSRTEFNKYCRRTEASTCEADGKLVPWLTRTPGSRGISLVAADGLDVDLIGYSFDSDIYIRPVMWINIEK